MFCFFGGALVCPQNCSTLSLRKEEWDQSFSQDNWMTKKYICLATMGISSTQTAPRKVNWRGRECTG